MDSVNDIVDENPNYENDSSDDDGENCELCNEKFGNENGQERSTSACRFGPHVVHASCLNKISNEYKIYIFYLKNRS